MVCLSFLGFWVLFPTFAKALRRLVAAENSAGAPLPKGIMANLGFIGLGTMGGQMVARLHSKGHKVIGYNRTQSKAQWLIDKGMQAASSPREVASAADITFAMVTNSAALTTIADGPDGLLAGLSSGKVFVDISTVSPAVSRNFDHLLRTLHAIHL